MQLHFDSSSVTILFNDIPLSSQIQKSYRHLQHLPTNFKPWDNPYYSKSMTDRDLISRLIEYGTKVGVAVDYDQCVSGNQEYFNLIHKIYEQNYNGNPEWLDFHEHIHICEELPARDKIKCFVIDYREKAGLLEKKFDFDWMKQTTTQVIAGDVYVQWAELGKTPYSYWENSEPDDINRLCELAKPWLKLRPKLTIALENFDFASRYNVLDFENWWSKYEQTWCKHWNISQWGIKEIASVSVVGKIVELDLFRTNLQKQKLPTHIRI